MLNPRTVSVLAAAWLVALLGVASASDQGEAEKPESRLNVGHPGRAKALSAAAIADAAGDQTAPAAAFDGHDLQYLVVWEHEYSASDHDIYARRVAADGSPLGSAFAVTTLTAWEGSPAVAFNTTDDEYLVVWEHEYSASDHDIYAQRIGTAGELLGSPFAITSLTNFESRPRIDFNQGDGEYLIAWEHLEAGGEVFQHDIRAQRLDGAGFYLGSVIVVRASALDEAMPAVAWGSAAHQYLVAWREVNAGSGDYDVYGQRLEADGALAGAAIPISTAPNDQLAPAVAFSDEAGLFLVVWQDHRSDTGEDPDIYGQRVAANGDLIGAEVVVSSSGSQDRLRPAVACPAQARSWVVAWEYEYSPSDLDLYRRRVALDGSPVEGEAVVSNSTANETAPALAPGADFDYLVVWEDARNAASQGIDVYGAVERFHRLSGRVFAGDVGDEASPLPGVEVSLLCSAEGFIPGSPLSSTVTAGDGWYGLVTGSSCEYYNVMETDPPGYASEGATTVDGLVIDANWIQYTPPLGEKVLTGNKFWDQDGDPPPGGWSGFTPDGWVSSQTVSCSVDVTDDGSGLDPATAEYSYTRDGGATWSPWAAAECSGSPGSLGPETITAASVPFDQDAGAAGLTRIRFRVDDVAGHTGVSADHLVPIDTTPPTSAVATLDPCQGATSFLVTWGADPDPGSPLASFDVRVVDEFGGVPDQHQWLTAVTQTSATFEGERGHTYSFSSRALDVAGNRESYPVTADAVTSVGCDVTVEVRSEGGVPRSGAKVYFRGSHLGQTDAAGTITAPSALPGDELLALYPVYEHPAVKPYHTAYGSGNWSYRVYQTSFPLAANGTPLPLQIADVHATQLLTVRPSQALVGFHMLVSVEFDANAAFVQSVRDKLEDASAFLYDVGDGQIFWDTIELFDNGVYWMGCDMQIHASNWGRAVAGYSGIAAGVTEHINLNRNDAFRTMIHEMGHYGLWLYDEYLDRDGQPSSDAYCASNFWTPPEEQRASIMNRQDLTSELCSRVDPNHQHRTNTQHDALIGGETTWETVQRVFADSVTPPRWIIRTPDDRGAVMPGPSALPAALTTLVVTDADTGACAPFTVTVRWPDGKPVIEAIVDVVAPSSKTLPQGRTNTVGELTVVGAHVGDSLSAYKGRAHAFASLSSCNPIAMELLIEREPPELLYEIDPLARDSVEILVQPSAPLVGDPVCTVWQEGAPSPLDVPLAWDPGRGAYTGQAMLDGGLEPAGSLNLSATLQSAASDLPAAARAGASPGGSAEPPTTSVTSRGRFTLYEAQPDQLTPRLYSDDGAFELVLPAGALVSEGIVAIHTIDGVGPPPVGMVQVGAAYRTALSTGQEGLDPPATVIMRYNRDQLGTAIEETLGIYSWDGGAGQWLATGSQLFEGNQLVTAATGQLAVLAILGADSTPLHADLELTKDDGLPDAAPGESLHYTIVASNAGPDGVTGALVSDPFPSPLTCSWTCSATAGAVCSPGPATGDIADVVDLPVASSITYSAVCAVDVAAAGVLTNTAVITSPDHVADPDPADNTATDTDLLLLLGGCGSPVTREVSGISIDSERTFQACHAIGASELSVTGPAGDLTLRAGSLVALGNGVKVERGSVLTVEIDPSLE